MRRIMLIGENGAGRRSLVRALGFAPRALKPSLAVEYAGPFVLPPPEFLENRRFYRALITTSMECDTLVLVQDATRPTSVFPPGFARTFNRRVLGVITKTDKNTANEARARRFLHSAGVKEILVVCPLAAFTEAAPTSAMPSAVPPNAALGDAILTSAPSASAPHTPPMEDGMKADAPGMHGMPALRAALALA